MVSWLATDNQRNPCALLEHKSQCLNKIKITIVYKYAPPGVHHLFHLLDGKIVIYENLFFFIEIRSFLKPKNGYTCIKNAFSSGQLLFRQKHVY